MYINKKMKCVVNYGCAGMFKPGENLYGSKAEIINRIFLREK